MKKQTRAGFLKSLLGIAASPVIISEVAENTSVYDGERVKSLTHDEPRKWDTNVSQSGLYTFCENNTRWRVGDIGQTDLGSLFMVTVITRLDGAMYRVGIRPVEIGYGKEFLYKNIVESAQVARTFTEKA